MSVQDDKDDKEAGREEDQQVTEKPEPDEEDKQKAAEMMKAYEDLPTVVLPGSGGMVSGTAVNDWLDEDGNPIHQEPEREGSEGGSDEQAKADEAADDESRKEQIEKDKALNEELRAASAAENKGEKQSAKS
ncbi:hypothetical protein [Mycobacterium sp.]|uniref:hypothetical protein n=1 Tax=Mycobacterium sp. TaxID=1785 RepID=UPI002C46A53E|nr:hypothetical protein [Mycobacterium sp.]HTY31143.1 hypothetical protein [Mycobacterium sp.]HUO38049.1 hypothetical protein [Mycobacterium sp.]HUO38080.1 hypothetical protein [Mycobacterium sp.]